MTAWVVCLVTIMTIDAQPNLPPTLVIIVLHLGWYAVSASMIPRFRTQISTTADLHHAPPESTLLFTRGGRHACTSHRVRTFPGV